MTTITYGYLELEYLVYPYLSSVVGESFNAQTSQQIISGNAIRSQAQRLITEFLQNFGAQFDQKIASSSNVRAQTTQQITAVTPIRSQQNSKIFDSQSILGQFNRLVGTSKITLSEFLAARSLIRYVVATLSMII